MLEVAKKRLRLPASLGLPLGISTVIERVSDPAFSTVVGLVAWGYAISDAQGRGHRFDLLSLGNVKGIQSTLVKWFKSLKP